MRYAVSLLLLVSFSAFGQKAKLQTLGDSLLTMSMAEAASFLALHDSDFYEFDEPPMILRGISGAKDSLEFRLYTERTSGFPGYDTINGVRKMKPAVPDWELIKDKPVVGYSLRKGSSSHSGGATLFYYNFDRIHIIDKEE